MSDLPTITKDPFPDGMAAAKHRAAPPTRLWSSTAPTMRFDGPKPGTDLRPTTYIGLFCSSEPPGASHRESLTT